ncbi:hypothetical protein B0H10DRAFT_1958071 [Mycena sp. CBHHK59/15]|nr:hypothetical protein B0H10DRAFT_1958071 [Mycena sp. CBHHK59/15]
MSYTPHQQEHEHGVRGRPMNTCVGGKPQQILEMDNDADTDMSMCCLAWCQWRWRWLSGRTSQTVIQTDALRTAQCGQEQAIGCQLLLANGAERERAPLCWMYEDTKTHKSANIALEMKPQTAQESNTSQKEWKWESTATSGWKAMQCHESQGKPSSGERRPGAKKTAGTT